MSRSATIEGFLAVHGFGEAKAEPLAQDASFRRYLRLTGGPRPAVLMDAPSPEDVGPFLRVAAHLAGIGVSVPDIVAADPEAGLVLEEDLGDALVSELIDRPGVKNRVASVPCVTLLNAAVETLAAIQRTEPPAGLPLWDAEIMAQTALGTLLDWWWPAAFGSAPSQAARDDFAAALRAMLGPVAAGPCCFVHRDYFAGNLLWLPDRRGIRRIGVLDFQSAALGHPAYDLASLLQDARRDIPSKVAEQVLEHYLAVRPDIDPAEFRAAYAACAAQRHLRVACQWVRLALRDHRPQYLAFGPGTWRLLDRALRQPAAAPLAEAMDRWIPSALRGNPQGLAV